MIDKLLRELLPTESYRRNLHQPTAHFPVASHAAGAPGSVALAETAQAMLLSADPTDRAAGMEALLGQGNVSGLAELEANQNAFLALPFSTVFPMTLKQYYRNPDPAGIAILGKIAQSSPNPTLVDAALGALAVIHTKDTLPYLASFLDSQNLELLKYATGGLASFANGIPIGKHTPTSSPYLTSDTIAHSCMSVECIAARPSYYRDFWKQWWAEHRAQLGF